MQSCVPFAQGESLVPDLVASQQRPAELRGGVMLTLPICPITCGPGRTCPVRPLSPQVSKSSGANCLPEPLGTSESTAWAEDCLVCSVQS